MPVSILSMIVFSFNASRLVTVWDAAHSPTLKWYGELLGNDEILGAAWLSIRIALIAASGAMVLGTLTGVALARFGPFRGRTLLVGMTTAPLVMPEVITGLPGSGVLAPGYVVLDGGAVAAVGAGPPPAPAGLALPDGILAPGFVDLQVNGYAGVDFNDDALNRDSVRFATLEPQEELWLRRILRRHLQLTGSPRAGDLLSCTALPLLRVEPVMPPCSIEDTWASILARLAAEEARSYGRDKLLTSERPVVQ